MTNSKESDQIITSVFLPQTAVSWLELILKVILITASLSAVYQYFDVKQENRVKKAMEFVNNFNNGQLQNAQLKLSEYWSDYEDGFEQLQGSIENEKERALIIETIVLPVVSKNYEHRANVDLLVNFFENLQTCIENRICDKDVSQSFFGKYAFSFFDLYQPLINKKRKLIPDYACQLQAFVQQTKCQ